MANLKTDSPLARRIVLSFFEFLNSVEPAPGVDIEGLEVAKECLADVFKIDPLTNKPLKSESLVEIFNSKDSLKSDPIHERFSADAGSSTSVQTVADASRAATSQFLDPDWAKEGHTQVMSKDELFGQYFDALEKVGYFKTMPDGNDDQIQLDKATQIFHNALTEMENSGCQTYNRKSLAEILKSQGNRAMQSKLYSDAIEIYTFAISLIEDNAVYYCNRAAAYTQIHQYIEAIRDCLKSIEIDPNYGKAYSRLGFAYYAQGKYRDAIDEGFVKALQLDPNNDSIKENIQVAEQKLIEEHWSTDHNQNSSTSSHQRDSNNQYAEEGSRSQGMPSPFTSMQFNTNGIPVDLASMFRNMTANIYQGPHYHNEPGVGSNSATFTEPEIGIGGNFNVNLGDQMPEQLSGALRSVVEMFSGAAPHGNSQDNVEGGSSPS